jgi:hypothetical protein
MPANKGFGTTISIGGVAIGTLVSVASPELSTDTIETTVLDTANAYRTFIAGLHDGGEVSISGYYDAGDAGQAALLTAHDASTVGTFVITFPASTIGATWTFSGIVTKLKTGEANLDDLLGYEASIKVTAKPVLGTTASTGASALTFVQTDGSTALTAAAMTPTFANGTFTYGFTYTTQTAFKPKVTAASHTIQIFVDDVFIETISSGVAGSDIAMAAVGAKRVRVVVYEAGKTPKTYNFTVSRLS